MKGSSLSKIRKKNCLTRVLIATYLNAEFSPQSVKLQPRMSVPKLSSDSHFGFSYFLFLAFTFFFSAAMLLHPPFFVCLHSAISVYCIVSNEAWISKIFFTGSCASWLNPLGSILNGFHNFSDWIIAERAAFFDKNHYALVTAAWRKVEISQYQ
jgi:hypothetical protein